MAKDVVLVPTTGTTVLPEGSDKTRLFAGVLRSFLSGTRGAPAHLEVQTEDGAMIVAENRDGFWRERGGSLTHASMLRLLHIEAEEHVVMEGLQGDGDEMASWGRYEVPQCQGHAVRSLMSSIVGEACEMGRDAVCGPFWLVDLCARLAMREAVVFVDPGQMWESTLRLLANWDVQAFVIAPGKEALEGEQALSRGRSELCRWRRMGVDVGHPQTLQMTGDERRRSDGMGRSMHPSMSRFDNRGREWTRLMRLRMHSRRGEIASWCVHISV
jgi:hypothetical protein